MHCTLSRRCSIKSNLVVRDSNISSKSDFVVLSNTADIETEFIVLDVGILNSNASSCEINSIVFIIVYSHIFNHDLVILLILLLLEDSKAVVIEVDFTVNKSNRNK